MWVGQGSFERARPTLGDQSGRQRAERVALQVEVEEIEPAHLLVAAEGVRLAILDAHALGGPLNLLVPLGDAGELVANAVEDEVERRVDLRIGHVPLLARHLLHETLKHLEELVGANGVKGAVAEALHDVS